jgi:cytochrome c-type biogenesis protein CcmH
MRGPSRLVASASRAGVILALTALLGLAAPALAKEATPLGDEPAIEARMMAMASELRCLVCQNQTLADSHADLAADLRQEIREMMKKGMSDEEIRAYLVDRYGDFVLYRPPWKTTTALLWAGPLLLVVVGGTVLASSLRRRRREALEDDAPLTDEERGRLRRILEETEGKVPPP